MTLQNDIQQLLFSKKMIKRVLQGAGIAFVLISVFILGIISSPNVSNPGMRMLIPMAAVTVGGGLGGVFYCMMDLFRNQENWKKILVNIVSVIVYFLALYLSLILALNAMGLWN